MKPTLSLFAVGVAVVVLSVSLAIIAREFVDARREPPIIISDVSQEQPVVVFVDGAVMVPGLYTLAPGARVQDAIGAAGGPSAMADISAVNPARLLVDGESVTVPEVVATVPPVSPATASARPTMVSPRPATTTLSTTGTPQVGGVALSSPAPPDPTPERPTPTRELGSPEDRAQAPVPTRPAAAESPHQAAASAPSGRIININTASEAELESLPGIGPALAQRIVEYRTEHGPFTSVDQLADVSGVSERMVDELRPLIAV